MLPQLDLLKLRELENRAATYGKTSEVYRYVPTLGLVNKISKYILGDLENLGKTSARLKVIPDAKSTQHCVEVLFNDLEQDLFGTPVIPRIVIWNSYNRECSLSLKVGVYRKVCNNGLTMSTDLFNQRAIHIRGQEIEIVLENFDQQVAQGIDYISSKMSSDFVGLLGGKLNRWEYNRILTAMVDRKIITDKVKNNILTAVSCNSLRIEDQSETLFSFYNLVNEHMRLSGKSRVAQERRNDNLLDQVVTVSRLAA